MKNQSQETGSTSAIAFILILAGLVLIAGLWFAVVYPVQLHEKAEADVQNTIADLTDATLMIAALPDSPYRDIEISVLLPAGSLATETSGTLYLNGEPIMTRSLSLQTEDATVGIAANGIWRRDAGNTGWVTLPHYTRNASCISLEIFTFENDLAYASSEMIPFRISYQESKTYTASGTEIMLRFALDTPGSDNLWRTYFQELAFKLQEISSSFDNLFDAEVRGDTLYLSAKLLTITLQITEHRYLVYTGDFV